MLTDFYSLVTYHVPDFSSETCDHCVAALKAELIQVPGVVGVQVQRTAGRVSIFTDGPVGEDVIRVAMKDAGCLAPVVPIAESRSGRNRVT